MFETIWETIKNCLSYTFAITPGQAFGYYTEMMILIAILVIGAYLLKTVYKKRVRDRDFVFKKMFRKLPNRLIYFAIGFLFLLLVRYENIPYFSMRFWLYLLLLGLLVMLGFSLYKYLKVYPNERDNFEARKVVKESDDSKSKYLPNKKRR